MVEPDEWKTGNAAPELAEIAKLLTEIGPDVNAIARKLGVYKETVRYRVSNAILRKGTDLQANVDCEALGLMRVAAATRLSEIFSPFAQQLFYALSELSYLTYYEQAMPEGFWMLHFDVPPEFCTRFENFIGRLKELGIFKSVEFFEYDWHGVVPMRTEFYDFKSHRWDFDWASSQHNPKISENPTRKSRRFDAVDLLILKELEIDANRTLSQIRDTLASKGNGNLKYKTLSYHYRTHISRGKLIKGYSIRWLGTGYDAEADKVGQRSHKYAVVGLVVRNVTPSEKINLRRAMNHLPFLWAEMAGKDYAAEFGFPLEIINEAMSYLTTAIQPVVERTKVFFVDQKNAVSFTIPYKSWNILDEQWRFEEESLLARFENLILQVKRGYVA